MKKRIIVCCDGTWNDLEMRYITNVGRLAQALLPVGPEPQCLPQLIFYDDGIGADDSGVKRMITGGAGLGMERNIYEAYRFLCFNYEAGDEVCLFGFSRGAYTVRSLSGMIGRAGLVDRRHLKQVPDALSVYRDRDDPDDAKAEAFRKKYSQVVPITLLGCWDTVGALGIPDKVPWLPFDEWVNAKYEFHNTRLGNHVERALHAVAIDEHREEFDVTGMGKEPTAPRGQVLREAWFPGDHGCVGGGSWEKRGLSNAALCWMIEEAARVGVELGVDLDRLRDKAISDHTIFFNNKVKGIYSEHKRKVRGHFSRLHESVKLRWLDNPDYRPANLDRFKKKLNTYQPAYVGVGKKVLARATTLRKDGHLDVRVMSRDKVGKTRIKLERGGRYQVEISPLQVWKDGGLDPVNATGWNENRAWDKGRPERFSKIKRRILRKARKNALSASANWFELVVATRDGNFIDLKLRRQYDRETPLTGEFTADRNGVLHLAANDLAHDWNFIDKYDNNRGWLWVRVHRLA